MSSLYVCRLRASRPHLSLRYQYLRQPLSTTRSNNATIPNNEKATRPAPSLSQTPLPTRSSFLQRNRSSIAWASLALLVGLLSGNALVHTVAPPALPEPGTHEDAVLMADLQKRVDEEFKVKVLRGKCLGTSKALRGAESGWVEIVPPPVQPRDSTDPDSKAEEQPRLVNTLRGAKGLGVERLFWDRGEQKLVAVVWFGGSLCGWPGVVHGGVIATQLVEKLALAAALAEDGIADFAAAAVPQRMPGTGNHAKMFIPAATPSEPAQLSLSYSKPTYANAFYVIRVSPAVETDQEPVGPPHSVPSGGHAFEATLETMDAKANAKAKANFPPSNTLQMASEKAIHSATRSYAEFKDWLWPSRQKQSQIG